LSDAISMPQALTSGHLAWLPVMSA